MEPGLMGETQEEIERVQAEAAGASNEPAAVAAAGDAPPPNAPSRKRLKKKTSPWWEHFTQGEADEDGSYTATCIYCGYVIIQGNQKGTSGLKGHIKKSCKKIPREKRFKPDAMQYMLQAAKEQDKRVFCLVLDNATSNDACIKELLSISSFQKELPVGGNIFHQRCGCHVLNLIVQDGLSVLNDEIENVRETMKYIRNSQSRMEKFNLAITQAKAPKKKPAWDVPTRWNSTFLMLELALELKDAIIRCKMAVVEYYFGELYPSGHAATFIDSLKQVLNALFKEYSESNPTSQSHSATSSTQSRSGSSSSVSNTKAGLKDFLNVRKTSEPFKSELEEYLTEPLDLASMDDDFDILAWWKLKVPKYPIMAKMTRDILAVPISTVASESTFSSAGRTLSPVRSSLSDESLQALICAQDWLRASVTEQGGNFGDVIWSSDEALDGDTICVTAASCT
ncbi:hypothetical protein LUZ63_005251 [Rhynchospora breviuscula]|uniref:BED-type domain-containing protein n=1 Tax=Rhynchospora breviuscula TaxID=2022672 RepID=A0A9Q0CNP1_9POAL|nr:hypothetical protein LUZ63_005251 [Rhynchospora breviuscula]